MSNQLSHYSAADLNWNRQRSLHPKSVIEAIALGIIRTIGWRLPFVLPVNYACVLERLAGHLATYGGGAEVITISLYEVHGRLKDWLFCDPDFIRWGFNIYPSDGRPAPGTPIDLAAVIDSAVAHLQWLTGGDPNCVPEPVGTDQGEQPSQYEGYGPPAGIETD